MPPRVWSNLRLADFTQYNAATYISGSVSDLGGALGWSIPILGGAGKSVSDPFSGWHAISTVPMNELFGATLTTSEWAALVGLCEMTHPGNSTDIDVVIGICNVAVDGGTNDWIGSGFRAGATRTGLTTQGSDGVATQTAGTTLGTIRRLRMPIIKCGTGTSGLVRPVAFYTDNSNLSVNASNGGISAGTSFVAGGAYNSWADAVPYLFVAAYRTSITDGVTRTAVYQPCNYPPFALTPPT